ncbi:tetratricopeptide repeat protein, partial [Patescibacteria group bacterium]|nr:tetratricopeptide repeat protein [Patescibacteria group bacterium]
GVIYFHNGDKEKAKEYIEKALEINPGDDRLRKTLEIVSNQGDSLYKESP